MINTNKQNTSIWTYAHPIIVEKCQSIFEAEKYALAVTTGIEEIIVRIRKFRDANGLEEINDDTQMLQITFDKEGNNLKFNALCTDDEKNIQEGYTKIFDGVMQAMRLNTEDASMSAAEAARKLLLVSDLMYKIDDALALLWKDSSLAS